jgi:hypothetical protein
MPETPTAVRTMIPNGLNLSLLGYVRGDGEEDWLCALDMLFIPPLAWAGRARRAWPGAGRVSGQGINQGVLGVWDRGPSA